MPNRVFVLSDLHGHFDIFLKMLEKIHFTDQDLLYVLGDCNDRGSQSMDIYRYLWQHKKNMILLKGNHELMMRDAFLADSPTSAYVRQWTRNGAKMTIESYEHYLKKSVLTERDFSIIHSAFQRMMCAYINQCPDFVELTVNNTNYVLVHAGFNPEKDLEEQNEEECCWMREYFFMSPGKPDKTIIFGHTPTTYMHGKPNCFDIWKDPIFNDKIGIDGGLGPFDEGQLNCLCLNTMEVTVIKKSELEVQQ